MANPLTKFKKEYSKELVWAAIALGVVLVLVLYFSSALDLSPGGLPGSKAPDIEYEMADGTRKSLNKQAGTTILVNFWASWCGPCMEEMPTLKMLENHFANKGFMVLAFNIEESRASNFKDKLPPSEKLPQNLIYNVSKQFLEPYGVNKLPVSVLIDRKGVIIKVYSGPQNWMDVSTIHEIDQVLRN